MEAHSLFVALWIFFGFTALVICGLIFLMVRPKANKDNRPPLQKP